MRILIFSVLPLPLLDRLGEYLAGVGHDVINLSGKRSRGRSSPGVRRMIMNFDEGGRGDNHVDAWKRALKNGSFGLKALRNLASSWQPDIILCRSGQGAAFFVREAFPEAFLLAFDSDPQESGIAVELDSRLFLESHLRFATDKRAVSKFPPLLRKAIQLEPICIETDFFRPGTGSPFSCWKLDSGSYRTIGIVLTGLSSDALQAWTKTIARFLARNRKMAIVALTDKGGVSAWLIKALGAMPGEISERIFITDHLEKDAWRNLCASVPLVFTSESQKTRALECVASGGSAWIARGAKLADVPGAAMFAPGKSLEEQLQAISLRPPDILAIENIGREYDCAAVIPDFAAKILSEYGKTVC